VADLGVAGLGSKEDFNFSKKDGSGLDCSFNK
jgi:hypothetical protein